MLVFLMEVVDGCHYRLDSFPHDDLLLGVGSTEIAQYRTFPSRIEVLVQYSAAPYYFFKYIYI